MENFDEKYLNDGVYLIPPSISFLVGQDEAKGLTSPNKEEKLFMETHPNWVVANAYETSDTIFLSEKPPLFTGSQIGSGFNYGSTNLLGLIPEGHQILILAEND